MSRLSTFISIILLTFAFATYALVFVLGYSAGAAIAMYGVIFSAAVRWLLS